MKQHHNTPSPYITYPYPFYSHRHRILVRYHFQIMGTDSVSEENAACRIVVNCSRGLSATAELLVTVRGALSVSDPCPQKSRITCMRISANIMRYAHPLLNERSFYSRHTYGPYKQRQTQQQEQPP